MEKKVSLSSTSPINQTGNICSIICATATLYNIGKTLEEEEFEGDEDEPDVIDNAIDIQADNDGLAFRRAFVAQHF